MIEAQSARDPADAATQLMRHVYGDGRGFVAIFTGRRVGDRLEDRDTRFYSHPDQLGAAISFAFEESERGREAYFCAHLLTECRRVKANAAPVLALWVDLDAGEIPNGDIQPTAVVESSPGRYQAFWRLTDAIPPELAERLNKRLALATGADPSGFDLSQVLRMPGTVNHKREQPTTVELRYVSGEARSYTPAELDELLPELPEQRRENRPVSSTRGTPAAGEPPVQLDEQALRVFSGADPKLTDDFAVDRSASLVKIARVLYDAGADRAVIVAALAERDATLYRKYTNRADAEERYHGIVDEVERNGRADPRRARLIAVQGGAGESAFNLTDAGNARRLVHRHGRGLRYCWPWGKWLVFDGARWTIDDTGEVYRLAKETVASTYREAAAAGSEEERKALAKHAMRSEGERAIAAMISLARSEPGVPVTPDQLDADPWLLNARNGTVDLRTGELREHRREDLITKLAPVEYDPDAEAPTWAAFLERVLPSEELRGFVQRGTGYSATGDTSEQAMLIHHGPGANGKSTYQETVSAALGDYALRTPTETLLAKRSGGVPNDIARLKGARFVTASETEEGRRLAESLIKDLTGQDTISARFMRAEWFDFKPTHKLHLSTNHKPEIRGTDNAIWRRIRLVPWGVTIPPAEQDRKLPEKLREELPGVLAWIVRGCLEWRRVGLRAPDAVKMATQDYRAEMDVLAAFIVECCVVSPSVSARATPLYHAYREWCERSGERAETQRRFGMRLTERGFKREKVGGVYHWYGIGISYLGPGPSGGDSEGESATNAGDSGGDGPTAGPSGGNGPDAKSAEFAGELPNDPQHAGPSGPKNNITGSKTSSRAAIRNKGPDGPDGPDDGHDASAGEEDADGYIWG